MEQWKKYNYNYEVSSEGRVRNRLTKKIKAQVEHKFGYMYISFYDSGKQKMKSVHRMVAEAFIPNPNNLREVNHINCNKKDNRVENLEWVTSSENKLKAIEEGIWENNKKNWFGERKPIIAVNLETNEKKRYISVNQAEKEHGKHISDVLKGKRKQTHGHFFYYEGGDAHVPRFKHND